MRTFVSFEADFPTGGTPAGRELAEFIAQALRSSGQAVGGPTNREDWAWDIHSESCKPPINSIVGYSDDGPRQWQIHTYIRRPFFHRLFRGKNASHDEQLFAYCSTIHKVIMTDDRFRSIRWYEQTVFDKDHGDTWGDAP
jgi:hypothetical protein